MKKIAVLLPVYKNDSIDFLKKSVGSILEQTIRDFHIYIGVDGPVGPNLDECLKTFDQEINITVVRFEVNRGLACVLNDLLDICFKEGYEYIARMDADDISLPDRLEKQLRFLQEHPEIDVVGGAIEEIDEKGNLRGKKVQYPLTNEDCRRFFRYRDPLAHPAVMFRNSFFKKAKGYRSEYRKNQDTMLWFDGFMNGCIFANLPETVLYFRITDDFYKSRRNGWARAKKMLTDRFMINHSLRYDVTAYLFSFAMFIMTLTPAWLKKIAYKVFR
jgi:glycosyltransferase involved in cell wall biosynthesis